MCCLGACGALLTDGLDSDSLSGCADRAAVLSKGQLRTELMPQHGGCFSLQFCGAG